MNIVDASSWRRPGLQDRESIVATVQQMLATIVREGWTAITSYSQALDGFSPQWLDLEEEPVLADPLKLAIHGAADRIRAFAQEQRNSIRNAVLEDDWGRFEQRVSPVTSAAAYCPGGRFPLISTALMTVIPAKVAGVPQVWALSPSTHPALRYALKIAGADGMLRLGGAQAIGAAVHGTPYFDPVQVIAGPGNAYVTEAKAQVQHRVGIDSLAGPSELLILSDGSANSEWLAWDLLAQAEHDPRAWSAVISMDRAFLQTLSTRLADMTQDPQILGQISFLFAESEKILLEVANDMAAEHVMVACPGNLNREKAWAEACHHYGSLFIGEQSAVAFGDYCSGPNHTLPTGGSARVQGGLSVFDFLRITTRQQLRPKRWSSLALGATLAQAEGLVAHEMSMKVRLQQDQEN